MLSSYNQVLLIIVYIAIMLRFCIFLIENYNWSILNQWFKNKLNELSSEFKRFKVHTILVIDYKKGNDYKIFHSSAKLIACDSDIDEAFKSMDKNVVTKVKNYKKYWIVLNVIIKRSIKIFEYAWKMMIISNLWQFYTNQIFF